ncbi:hypothetical protein ZOSMA_30G00560 [Zostera marina]|uniref:Uncharacterized protein n=1 Tax=Zostera marina TaxID=29655 RepID=A0A0K9P9Y4_ZOSMR|nr:hypothetical protein ZOSMA_30G00560 [Zostera marina]
MDRFTESLFYSLTMFDASGGNNEQRGLAEVYLQREICNVLCCEGASRTERNEPLTKWRARMSGAGFKTRHLESNAYKQASMLLTLFSGDGYCVEEIDGYLMFGWHNRPLISASAWRIRDDVGNSNCSTDETAQPSQD